MSVPAVSYDRVPEESSLPFFGETTHQLDHPDVSAVRGRLDNPTDFVSFACPFVVTVYDGILELRIKVDDDSVVTCLLYPGDWAFGQPAGDARARPVSFARFQDRPVDMSIRVSAGSELLQPASVEQIDDTRLAEMLAADEPQTAEALANSEFHGLHIASLKHPLYEVPFGSNKQFVLYDSDRQRDLPEHTKLGALWWGEEDENPGVAEEVNGHIHGPDDKVGDEKVTEEIEIPWGDMAMWARKWGLFDKTFVAIRGGVEHAWGFLMRVLAQKPRIPDSLRMRLKIPANKNAVMYFRYREGGAASSAVWNEPSIEELADQNLETLPSITQVTTEG